MEQIAAGLARVEDAARTGLLALFALAIGLTGMLRLPDAAPAPSALRPLAAPQAGLAAEVSPGDTRRRFLTRLADSYLHWSALMQTNGHEQAAERLTVKALAAHRGEPMDPEALLDAPGPLGGASLLKTAAMALKAPQVRLDAQTAVTAARAQAAFDCWLLARLDDMPEAHFAACRHEALRLTARLQGRQRAES